MKQRWWLLAAGVVGIGLAILLFPKPDTGGDIPNPTPGRVDFNAAPEDAEPGERADGAKGLKRAERSPVKIPASGGPRIGPVANLDPATIERVRRGPSPMALENVRMRSQPEAVFAGRVAGPLSLMRRQLLLSDSDAAKDLGNEMAGLVSALREQRRDPRVHDFDILLQQAQDFGERIRGDAAFMQDEQVAQSIARLDEVIAEYTEVSSSPNPQ